MTEQIILNDYSQKVFDLLNERRPDLGKYLSLLPDEYMDNHYLEIKMTPPNKNINHDLFLSTEGKRLNVGLDEFHCHFDSFDNCIFEEEMTAALNTFDKIISEELVEVCYYRNENIMASGLATTGLINEIESNMSIDLKRNCDKISFVSWTGKYDSSRDLTSS